MTRSIALTLFIFIAASFTASCGNDDHDHEHEHHDIVAIEIVDRGQTEMPTIATWTADSGWTGGLPEASLSADNPRISLGVRALCSHGDDLIQKNEDLEARYKLAEGAPGEIIDLDRNDVFHGDHVHIYGVSAGTTQVEFLVWHVDHADAVTEPIAITIID